MDGKLDLIIFIICRLKGLFKITGGDNSLTEDKKEGLFGSVSYGIVIV